MVGQPLSGSFEYCDQKLPLSMPSPYLSKSDFKSCFYCRTKLFYRKNSYHTNLDENEYMQFLADGGFMIEVVAKAKYPRGTDLAGERDQVVAFDRTKELIAASKDAVVFEAAALHGKYLARIDILRRENGTLHLIEVKSSSITTLENDNDAESPFMGKRNPNKVSSKWEPYILDVAFQAHVLRLAFPTFKVIPWLCVVDKAYGVTANETLAHFQLSRDETNPKARPQVEYSGDRAALKKSRLLVTRNVEKETDSLMEEVIARAKELAALLGNNGKVTRVQEAVADFYKTCLVACQWAKELGVTMIGTGQIPDPVPDLVAAGHTSLLDLEEDQLGKEGGAWQIRRHMQWANSANGGTEHLPAALRRELRSHKTDPGWPLHFVDFEACNVALPHHAGLRPYERVAFQWSCHTIDKKGDLAHAEWLNTGRDFPNFAFAQSLRQQIGNKGTVYVWSHYEQSTLQRVLTQIEEWVKRDAQEALRVSGLRSPAELDALADWIDQLLGHMDDKSKRHDSPRIRDLHKLALEHYFHPEMLGRTSIKVVLPAIWRHDSALRANPWFSGYLQLGPDGQPLDPYKTLPALPLGEDDEDEAIVEGTGAIRVYQDLIFRQEVDPQVKVNREQLLKQYCQLDTLAMVMIWKHWIG